MLHHTHNQRKQSHSAYRAQSESSTTVYAANTVDDGTAKTIHVSLLWLPLRQKVKGNSADLIRMLLR